MTIGAMGCQTEIASAILDREADYVLAVKDNQLTLQRGVEDYFLEHMEDDFATIAVSQHEAKEKGHRRVEHRTYYVCDAPADLPDRKCWKGLAAIGIAINNSIRNGKDTDAVRHCILIRRLEAKEFGDAVHSHWGIEIPQSDCPQSDNLYVAGRSGYHHGGGLAHASLVA